MFALYSVLLAVWVHIAWVVSIISTFTVLAVFLEDNSSLPERRAELPRSEAQRWQFFVTSRLRLVNVDSVKHVFKTVQNLVTWQLKYHTASSVHFSAIESMGVINSKYLR